MTISTALLFIFGALAGLVALCLLVIWFEKHGPEGDYDERQRIARGNAYRISFWVGTAYAIFWAFYLIFSDPSSLPVSPFYLILLGLCMVAMVFHIYCLLTRSALPLSGSPLLISGGYALAALLHLISFFISISPPEYPRPDSDTLLFRLTISMCFAALAVMYLIPAFWREKE